MGRPTPTLESAKEPCFEAHQKCVLPCGLFQQPAKTIREIINFIGDHYPPRPAENTRETVRDEVVKYFVTHGLLVRNADDPMRPTNSSKTNYRLSHEALPVCQAKKSGGFEKTLAKFLSGAEGVRAELNRTRTMALLPVRTTTGEVFLSPGAQSPIIKAILEQFAPRFVPGATLLYVGDTASKFAIYEKTDFAKLGLIFDSSEKMPDVVFHDTNRGWLVLVEAVASDGAVDGKRRMELKKLFSTNEAGLVFVTAFADRANLRKHIADVAWETEVWLADAPEHMIHLNGVLFPGPYDDVKAGRLK